MWGDGRKHSVSNVSGRLGAAITAEVSPFYLVPKLVQWSYPQSAKKIWSFSTATTRVGGKESSVMILPQVHLRKPCYDFYFL